MAGRARQVAAMVLRFVGQPSVTEIGREPGTGAVAQTAILSGVEVPWILTCRCCAVMAGRAGTQYLSVIDQNHGRPHGWTVTVFADVGRRRVSRTFTGGVGAIVAADAVPRDIRVIKVRGCPGDSRVAVVAVIATGDVRRVFAGGYRAIVASVASTNHLSMVDYIRWYPRIRRVAILANIGSLNVVLILARRVDPVVATDAVTRNIHVVEVCWQPARCRVTVLTVVTAGDVCQGLAGRDDAIMACAASAKHLRVVDRIDRHPDIGVVAVLANIRRLDVRGAFAGSRNTVVATETVSSDANVIEIRRQPAGRRMTVVAVVATCNVGRILSGCGYAIVAGAARAQNLGMVNRIGGHKYIRVVTIFANIGGLYMCQSLAHGSNAVMAAEAVANNADVIEVCRPPRNRGVAVVAGIATSNMGRSLTRGNGAIVAGVARADDLRVIHPEDGCKDVGRVAVLTNVAG